MHGMCYHMKIIFEVVILILSPKIL